MVRVAKASIQKEFSMMVQNLKDSQERTMERIKRKNENFYLHAKKPGLFIGTRRDDAVSCDG